MMRLERPLRRALVAAGACVVLTAVVVPAVAAADDIPRPPGAIDGRGWEMVSAADKDRNSITLATPLTSDGSKLLYSMGGPSPGASSGSGTVLIATRTGSGWTAQSIIPPYGDLFAPRYIVSAATPDLGELVASAFTGLGRANASPDVSLVTLDGAGGQSLLHTFPTFFGPSGIDVVASDDLSHVYANVTADSDPLLPDVVPGVDLVYDFGGGTPQLVSRMPGTDLAPACGTPRGTNAFAEGGLAIASEHWVSTDGRRVFFATSGDNCGDPMQLYMRDVAAGTTTLISGPPVGAASDNGIDRFLQATPDGAQVFYRTATSYDQADTDVDADDTDMDVYRWTAATGRNVCITCGVPSAQVLDPTAVSEDGSHVYFSSENRLADAPTAADTTWPNTYVWQVGHPSVRFVARTNGVTPRPQANGYVAPNGRTLIFASNYPGLDSLTAGSNGGFLQYYRYSSSDGEVTCISCPPGGVPATRDIASSLAVGAFAVMSHVRAASDDGSMVFFTTADALVPEDSNANWDIYEWHDGSVGLITSGTAPYTRGFTPLVVSASADGHDVVFVDTARLTSDAQDDAWKLYDARVGGGFSPAPPAPPVCHGDCRGAAATPPSLGATGSDSSSGAGNATPGAPGSIALAKLTRAQRARFARIGRIALSVRVSGPGTLEAAADGKVGKRSRLLAHGTAKASAAGRTELVVRLTRAARRELARAGRLRVALVVAFSDATDGRRLVIVLKRHGHGGASSAARAVAAVHATADGR